jgi:hypothetical protein
MIDLINIINPQNSNCTQATYAGLSAIGQQASSENKPYCFLLLGMVCALHNQNCISEVQLNTAVESIQNIGELNG